MEKLKRKLMTMGALLSLVPMLSSCKASALTKPPQGPHLTPAQQRLQNLGLALVVDAVEGAEMLGVEFFADDSEFPFFAKSRLVRNNRTTMSFPSGVVPEKLRVTWRRRDESYWKDGRIRYGGEFAGNYIIPIASRIPNDVVQEIRKNGGGLRLKFRLHPDGVFFGWDIERFAGGLPRHSIAGGDFREANIAYELPFYHQAYLNPYTDRARLNPAAKPYLDSGEYFIPPRASDIWRKGWYIEKDGRKVLIDY